MSVRRIATASASASALLLTLGLTACGQAPAAEACAPQLQSGSITDTVTALGEFGTEPVVNIPTPVGSAASQRLVAHAAEDRSELAQPGDVVSFDFAMYEGATGQLVQSTPFGSPNGSTAILMDDTMTLPGMVKGFTCAAPGDRLIVSMAPQDAFGVEQNLMQGLPADTAMILVADVRSVGEMRATGKERNLPSGFPAVVSDEAGKPGIVMPPSKAPAETRAAVAIEGSGDEVTKDDALIAQVMSVDWESGRVTRSSWDQGTPVMLDKTGSGEALRGFLDGSTVGSRVVVLLVEDGSTTVNVVDVLARTLSQSQ